MAAAAVSPVGDVGGGMAAEIVFDVVTCPLVGPPEAAT